MGKSIDERTVPSPTETPVTLVSSGSEGMDGLATEESEESWDGVNEGVGKANHGRDSVGPNEKPSGELMPWEGNPYCALKYRTTFMTPFSSRICVMMVSKSSLE
jgi:hypothetical protein